MRAMGADVESLPLGARVVVRHRLTAPDAFGHTLTDVVGDLVARDAVALVVATRRGEVVVPRDLVEVVKALPPRPGRRGAAHRALSVEGLQEVMVGAWGALEREWLGRWQLRAGAGYTMRANSVALLGSPGVPLADAVARSFAWYAARGLPLNVTLAGPVGFAVESDPLGVELLARGARQAERCLTMTADTGAVLASHDVRPRRGAPEDALARTHGIEVGEDLSEDWLEAHRGYRTTNRLTASGAVDDTWAVTARRILTGSPGQLFATLRAANGEVIGLGRGGLTPGWVGLGSIWVAPAHRRRGLAHALTLALLAEAARRGHRSAHLQVLSDNAPARALYAAMGFEPHHDYVNVIEETRP